MVSSLSHPSPISAIDPKRIAANSGVLLVHALVFAALMLPSNWTPPAVSHKAPDLVVVPEIVKPIEIKPTDPPPKPRPEPRPVVAQVTPVIPKLDAPPIDLPPIFEQGEIAADPVEDSGPPVSFDTGPQLADLAYASNPPPRYPRLALRAGDEGRVLLRVLVDAQGRPQEVEIEKSSGHRDLDRAAREQVLAKWRFHPAQRDGLPVSAWALVPIDFNLP